MIGPEKRRAIYRLHQEGMSQREMSRRLGVSRKTVRSIVKAKGAMPAAPRNDKVHIDPELLQRLYNECDGWKQRVHEKLVEEEGIDVKYSTLTRMLRDLGMGSAVKKRCDRVPDEPGAEMQHDTTVYQVPLGDKRARLTASVIYLRYSKRKYLKFYRSFNRFWMKCFLHEALTFWGFAAEVCIIDNTNLARLRGTGKDAVIVPEMEAFSKQYGFRFECHEKGHANRKAGNERSFFTVETNFLPGRRFQRLEDLNEQAFQWATVKMENKAVGKSKLIPAKAFEHEQAYLAKLPPHLPTPYLPLDRQIDQYGYVSIDANFYWVPGKGRGTVQVLLYGEHAEIYRGRELLIEYRLPADGVRNKNFSPEGFPKPPYKPKNRKKPTAEEETRLRDMAPGVGAYLDFALKTKGPQQRHRLIRELFRLTRKMTSTLFCRTLERALKYRITDLETIQRIAHLAMCEGDETIPYAEVDESFRERDAYVEGRLTDEPDFAPYDDLLEEDDG